MGESQLNVRLTREAADALDAAVFVRELRSPHELVAPAIEELARELLEDADVADAVAIRGRRRAPDNVAPIGKRKPASSRPPRAGRKTP